jgi:hypothetical protein
MAIMTNEEKILILQARLEAVELGLIWLNNNPSEGEIPEGKKSTEDQINELSSKKTIYLQMLDDLA